jgi:hypothetical protein
MPITKVKDGWKVSYGGKSVVVKTKAEAEKIQKQYKARNK